MKTDTRQRLIDTCYEEMYTKGFHGLVLDEVLALAGVHKGSMYHFFKSKKEMALTAIAEKMAERFAVRYFAKKPYLDTLFAMLHDTSIRDFKRGCPLANLVQEMSNLDEDFDAVLKRIYADFRNSLQVIYDHAIKNSELAPCDTSKLALFTVVTIEGAILSAKASGDDKDYSNAIEMLEIYVKNRGISTMQQDEF